MCVSGALNSPTHLGPKDMKALANFVAQLLVVDGFEFEIDDPIVVEPADVE
jgi:hypothetical protein